MPPGVSAQDTGVGGGLAAVWSLEGALPLDLSDGDSQLPDPGGTEARSP